MVSVPKTSWSALFAFKVPTNMTSVKMPHIPKYAAIEVASGASASPSFGSTSRATSVSQNAP